jgi:alpha,alpha-trehalose-phosphate synthase [UDP-forming]
MIKSPRMIVVSNRLPITVDTSYGDIELKPSSGGLVSALLPVCKRSRGSWIGWPGIEFDPEIAEALRFEGCPDYSLHPVFLPQQQVSAYYDGFCNGIIWPLFHDMEACSVPDPSWWEAYREVNQKFASVVLRIADRDDVVWVHDYHLMLCAAALRKRGLKSRVGYFHHIPFPSADVFQKMPWCEHILKALLQYDVVGFQSARDKSNFLSCVRRFIPGVRLQRAGNCMMVISGESVSTVGVFPIGIDFDSIDELSRSEVVQQRTMQVTGSHNGGKMLFGVDRLDYTKGILERIRAIDLLLEENPELHEKIRLVQVVVPSRENVDRYSRLKAEIESLVSRVNGKYATATWTPITYLYKSISRSELIALYRSAEVMLVTSLRDGMNLVAKEFCAARADAQGALIVSEFAGAAAELRTGALVINPYNVAGISRAVRTALSLSPADQQRRMQAMRRVVKAGNVFRWAESFEAVLRPSMEPMVVLRSERLGAVMARATAAN